MTMFNHTSGDFVIPVASRKSLRFYFARFADRFNGWVNAVVAHREHRAQLFVLRRLSDRDLKDFGINRSQICKGLAEAAADLSRRQQSRK